MLTLSLVPSYPGTALSGGVQVSVNLNLLETCNFTHVYEEQRFGEGAMCEGSYAVRSVAPFEVVRFWVSICVFRYHLLLRSGHMMTLVFWKL